MRCVLIAAALMLATHGVALAQAKPKACPPDKPSKSAVIYSASFADGGTAVGRIFICSTAPINTEALWLEAEEHIRRRKDMAGAKSVQITNILNLRR